MAIARGPAPRFKKSALVVPGSEAHKVDVAARARVQPMKVVRMRSGASTRESHRRPEIFQFDLERAKMSPMGKGSKAGISVKAEKERRYSDIEEDINKPSPAMIYETAGVTDPDFMAGMKNE